MSVQHPELDDHYLIAIVGEDKWQDICEFEKGVRRKLAKKRLWRMKRPMIIKRIISLVLVTLFIGKSIEYAYLLSISAPLHKACNIEMYVNTPLSIFLAIIFFIWFNGNDVKSRS